MRTDPTSGSAGDNPLAPLKAADLPRSLPFEAVVLAQRARPFSLHLSEFRSVLTRQSVAAGVRLRTHRTKGGGSRIATLTMVFKLGLEAQKHWRRLQGFELMPKVVTGVRFVDGEEQTQQAA